ncbi:hypothetical protein PYCCODRAFT_41598 [Trametes coccinea BRFM310]|uniref:C3H1-type domain-containing protein n=1 Tax=Trametes coccinea (strain BRFM310) TaxID=1353009 RepID=A0A1Y2J5K9_TRAC3|nr:hypothetical protein PYCCODRAFT_41598 [Trametes coccinea BRFM310]
MPWPRCKFYDDDGRPVGRGCLKGSECRFVHPGDPRWDNAPKPKTSFGPRGGGPSRGGGRGGGDPPQRDGGWSQRASTSGGGGAGGSWAQDASSSNAARWERAGVGVRPLPHLPPLPPPPRGARLKTAGAHQPAAGVHRRLRHRHRPPMV